MSYKLAEIERLRALAILMVILAHIPYFHQFLHPALYQTFAGVDLFFVISGFVVYRAFHRSLPDLETGDFFSRLQTAATAMKNFYWRRIFRILPLAILWALIPLSVVWFSSDRTLFKDIGDFQIASEFLAIITFQYNYGYVFNEFPGVLSHYWSLSVEEHFYLVLPLSVVMIGSFKRQFLFFVAISLATVFVLRPLIPSEASGYENWNWLRMATHNRLDALAVGVLLAMWQIKSPPSRFRARKFGQVLAYFSIGLLCFAPATFHGGHGHMAQMNLLVFTFAAAILVYLASCNQNLVLNWGPLNKLLNLIGARSYAMYLIHMPAYWFAEKISQVLAAENSAPLIWLSLSIIFVEASHRLVELPLMRYSRKHQLKVEEDSAPARLAA